jgi:hypothetical protein
MVSPPDYSDAFDPTGKDAKTLEKCITSRIDSYTDLYDDELWLLFKRDFTSWTEGDLRNVPMPSLFKLRKILRSNGVFVAKDRRTPEIPLAEAKDREETYEWEEKDVISLLQQYEQLNSLNLQLNYAKAIENLQNCATRAP